MTPPNGFLDLLAAARVTGLSIAELMEHTAVIAGESVIPESVVRALAEQQNARGKEELQAYWNGEVAAQDRKY